MTTAGVLLPDSLLFCCLPSPARLALDVPLLGIRAHPPNKTNHTPPTCKTRNSSHAAAASSGGGGKDGKGGADSNKRHRADSHGKLLDASAIAGSAGSGSGSERNPRGRRGGVRQRERDERKRERADSRDDSRDAPAGGGRNSGGGGRDPKPRGKEGGAGRGAGGRDSFAGGAGGPPFRDLENWDPEKALIRSLFLADELDKVRVVAVQICA